MMEQTEEKTRISNLCWHLDEYGDYWTADMLDLPGITGTFYNFEEDGKRASVEDQQANLEAFYEVV